MSKEDGRTRFTFRIPEELLNSLKYESERIGVSVNALILQILWEWVEKKEKEPDRRWCKSGQRTNDNPPYCSNTGGTG